MRLNSTIVSTIHRWLSLTGDDDAPLHIVLYALGRRLFWVSLFGFLTVAVVRFSATIRWQPETPDVIDYGVDEGIDFLFHGASKRTQPIAVAERPREIWLNVARHSSDSLRPAEKMGLAEILCRHRKGDVVLRLLREAVESEPRNVELRRQMAHLLLHVNRRAIEADGLQQWLNVLEGSRNVDPDNSLYDDTAAAICSSLGAPSIPARRGKVTDGYLRPALLRKSDEYLNAAAECSGLYPAKNFWTAKQQLAERLGLHRVAATLLANSRTDPLKVIQFVPDRWIRRLNSSSQLSEVKEAMERVEQLVPRLYALERRTSTQRRQFWALEQLQELRHRFRNGSIAEGQGGNFPELDDAVRKIGELDNEDPIYGLKRTAWGNVMQRLNSRWEYSIGSLGVSFGAIMIGSFLLVFAAMLYLGGRRREASRLRFEWIVPLRLVSVGVFVYLLTSGVLMEYVVHYRWLLFVLQCCFFALIVLVARLARGVWWRPELFLALLLLAVAWAFADLADGYSLRDCLERWLGFSAWRLRAPLSPFPEWVAGGGLQLAIAVALVTEMIYAIALRCRHGNGHGNGGLSLRRLLADRLARPTCAAGMFLLAAGLFIVGDVIRDSTHHYRLEQFRADGRWQSMILDEVAKLRRDTTIVSSCRADVRKDQERMNRQMQLRFSRQISDTNATALD